MLAVVSPHPVVDHLTGEDAWAVRDQQMRQVELELRERDVLVGACDRTTIDVEHDPATHPLAFGMGGAAAIYTDRYRPVHIIRKVMLRMQSWMDYVR